MFTPIDYSAFYWLEFIFLTIFTVTMSAVLYGIILGLTNDGK